MRLIYVAHPFGGSASNLDAAERWVAFLCANFHAVFFAPWIPLCRLWPDTGEARSRGLMCDFAAIRASQGSIFVGGGMTPGITQEWRVAVDLHKFQNRDDTILFPLDMSGVSSPERLSMYPESMDLIRRWLEGGAV